MNEQGESLRCNEEKRKLKLNVLDYYYSIKANTGNKNSMG
jgi:hypothetical protein